MSNNLETTDVMVNKKVFDVIVELLRYSFYQTNWDFFFLTEREKEIIRDQDTLNMIRVIADKR